MRNFAAPRVVRLRVRAVPDELPWYETTTLDVQAWAQCIAPAGTASSRPTARGARLSSKITAPPGQYGCGAVALWTSSGS